MRVKKFQLENNIPWFQNNIACLQPLAEMRQPGEGIVKGSVRQVIQDGRSY